MLLLPETRDGHERRLLEKGVYTAEQVRLTLDRAEHYADFHGQHPGFFDTIVLSGGVSSLTHVHKSAFNFIQFVFFVFTFCFF